METFLLRNLMFLSFWKIWMIPLTKLIGHTENHWVFQVHIVNEREKKESQQRKGSMHTCINAKVGNKSSHHAYTNNLSTSRMHEFVFTWLIICNKCPTSFLSVLFFPLSFMSTRCSIRTSIVWIEKSHELRCQLVLVCKTWLYRLSNQSACIETLLIRSLFKYMFTAYIVEFRFDN